MPVPSEPAESPPPAGNVVQHYPLRDILAMYPNLREDHVRYLQKWGLVERIGQSRVDRVCSFADISMLRQVSADIARGIPFRAVVRALAAERYGQMALDFTGGAQPGRVVELRRRTAGQVSVAAELLIDRGRADACFSEASALDDGTPANHEAAAQAYRKALEADPYLIPALINLGNLHYARDQLAEAQALYERALQLAPEVHEAHFNLGNVHHDLGRLELARECYAEAVRLSPEYAEAHFYLAVTLEKMGRSQEARPHWREYQRLAPDGEWIDLAREFGD